MADITPLVTGRSFLEGPRWHDGALYLSDMHGDAVLRVTENGDVSVVVEVEQPSGLGWLPDGSLLISAMTRRCVMRYDGNDLTVHADLSELSDHEINDMCVDQHGHAFVGQFGYDLRGGGSPAPAALLRVDPDGSAHEVAPDLRMANGMVITADQSNRRIWAELPDAPDGIGIDDDDGVWVAGVVADRFARVVEGGKVTHTIETPGRHPIACAVGGADGHTLFMLTATTLGERDKSQAEMSAAIETTRV
jgi:sugar lactone lactonase YvrE